MRHPDKLQENRPQGGGRKLCRHIEPDFGRPQMFRISSLLPVVFLLASCPVMAQETGEQVGEAKQKAAPQYETIFDGTSMDAFRGYHQEAIGQGWKIDNGALHYDGSGGGDIVTKKEYGNFELQFEWKVAPAANSGVIYRVTLGDSASYFSGPEFQILDDDGHPNGKKEITSAGSLYGMYKPTNKKLNPVGSWNQSKIVLRGKQIEHWINGQKVVAAEIDSKDWNERKNASKFKDWDKFGAAAKGRICFQDHGDKVWFRMIKVRPLDP